MNLKEMREHFGKDYIYVYHPDNDSDYKVKLESFLKADENEYWITIPGEKKVILNKEQINTLFKNGTLKIYVLQEINIVE